MRCNSRNVGLREGLLDQKHRERLGPARHLFEWLIARQTQQRRGVGLVLGGAPLSYRRIGGETGYPERSLRRWMRRLVEQGYIQLSHVDRKRMVVAVLRAKKFAVEAAVETPVDTGGKPCAKAVQGGNSKRPEVADLKRPEVAVLESTVLMCGLKELREKESQQQEPAAASALPTSAVEKPSEPPRPQTGAEMAQQFATEGQAGQGQFVRALRRLAHQHSLPGLVLTPRQFAARQRQRERQRQELLGRSPPQSDAA